MTWIRRGGQLYGDAWHLQRDPAPGRASRGLRVAACGSTFAPGSLLDEWPGGDAPSEERRCPGCEGAYASIEGQVPRGTVPHG